MISEKLDLNHPKSTLSEKEIKEKESISNKFTLKYFFIKLSLLLFTFSFVYIISKSILPDLTSIIINFSLAENLKDQSAALSDIMNYFYYILSSVFSLLFIYNLYKHFNHHKQEPANPAREKIKIPTQNKKEVLDKIGNF